MTVMVVTMMAMMVTTIASAMVPVGDKAMQSVSVGLGGVWAVDHSDKIYYLADTYGKDGNPGTHWILVSGGLKQLDVGAHIVWGVNGDNSVYYRTGMTNSTPTGTKWTMIDGKMKYVTVSPGGDVVWAVDSEDEIFRRDGITPSNPGGTNWTNIPGSLKQISIGPSGVWGVNRHNHVYIRDDTFGSYNTVGPKWTQIPDMTMTYVSSAFGTVLGIAQGRLYARQNMSFAQPTGEWWKHIEEEDTGMMAVDSLFGYFWACKSSSQNAVFYNYLQPGCFYIAKAELQEPQI